MKKIASIFALASLVLASCVDLEPLEQRVGALETSVQEIQTALEGINADVVALQQLAALAQEAIEAQAGAPVIAGATCEDNVWTLTLTNGQTITVAVSGATGNAPVLEYDAASYIVTANGVTVVEWDEAPAAVEYSLKIDADGNWVAVVNGTEYVIKDADGKTIKAVVEVSDGYFESVTLNGDVLLVKVKGQEEPYQLLVVGNFKFIIKAEGVQEILKGQSVSFDLELEDIVDAVITCPEGFDAEIANDKLIVTALDVPGTTKALNVGSQKGCIVITAISSKGFATKAALEVSAIRESYLASWIAGDAIEIDGKLYSKATTLAIDMDSSHGYALVEKNTPLNVVHIEKDTTVTSPAWKSTIVFVEPEATVTIAGGGARIGHNFLIIGNIRHQRAKLVIPAGADFAAIGHGDIVFKNMDITVAKNFPMWTAVYAHMEKTVIDDCKLTISGVTGFLNYPTVDFSLINSDVALPAGGRVMAANASFVTGNYKINNNLVYSATGEYINANICGTGSATMAPAHNATFLHNTFINLPGCVVVGPKSLDGTLSAHYNYVVNNVEGWEAGDAESTQANAEALLTSMNIKTNFWLVRGTVAEDMPCPVKDLNQTDSGQYMNGGFCSQWIGSGNDAQGKWYNGIQYDGTGLVWSRYWEKQACGFESFDFANGVFPKKEGWENMGAIR